MDEVEQNKGDPDGPEESPNQKEGRLEAKGLLWASEIWEALTMAEGAAG